LTDCSKIRIHWKIVIIFDHPRRTLVWTDVRGTAPPFCKANEEHKESGIILDLTRCGQHLNNRAAILQSKIT
jgi:hypothetical protein